MTITGGSMKVPNIKMSDPIRGGTISVQVCLTRDWRYRLGMWLIRMGCAVLRCRFKAEEAE